MPGEIMYASAMQCQPVHTKWHRFSFAGVAFSALMKHVGQFLKI